MTVNQQQKFDTSFVELLRTYFRVEVEKNIDKKITPQFIQAASKNPNMQLVLAVCYGKINKIKATKELESILQIKSNPLKNYAAIILARMQLENGQVEESIANLLQFTQSTYGKHKLLDCYPLARKQLGDCYWQQGDFIKAIAAYLDAQNLGLEAYITVLEGLVVKNETFNDFQKFCAFHNLKPQIIYKLIRLCHSEGIINDHCYRNKLLKINIENDSKLQSKVLYQLTCLDIRTRTHLAEGSNRLYQLWEEPSLQVSSKAEKEKKIAKQAVTRSSRPDQLKMTLNDAFALAFKCLIFTLPFSLAFVFAQTVYNRTQWRTLTENDLADGVKISDTKLNQSKGFEHEFMNLKLALALSLSSHGLFSAPSIVKQDGAGSLPTHENLGDSSPSAP